MARIRTVKPELFRHEFLYETENHYGLPLRLAFIGLFTACDREGRFKWRPRELKLDIFPYDEVDFSSILNALLVTRFIKAYEVDGAYYGFIPSWKKHQVINNRERQSDFPEPQPPFIVDMSHLTCAPRVIDASSTPLLPAPGEGKGKGTGREEDICKVSNKTSPHSSYEDDRTANADVTGDEGKEQRYNSQKHKDDKSMISEVFSYWQVKMNHPRAKLDKKRKSVIQAAINQGYSLEELKQAIDGCNKTPHNMGENLQKKKYDDIGLILRDASHIERFMENSKENSSESSLDLKVSQIDQIAEGAI